MEVNADIKDVKFLGAAEAERRMRAYEGTGCLVLYRYEWSAPSCSGSHVYWAHVKFDGADGEYNDDGSIGGHGDRWIEICADDEIDLDCVIDVAPLPDDFPR